MAVAEVFGPIYLRAPNKQNKAQILAYNTLRGFIAMFESIDMLSICLVTLVQMSYKRMWCVS
jgi:hypothetical protein